MGDEGLLVARLRLSPLDDGTDVGASTEAVSSDKIVSVSSLAVVVVSLVRVVFVSSAVLEVSPVSSDSVSANDLVSAAGLSADLRLYVEVERLVWLSLVGTFSREFRLVSGTELGAVAEVVVDLVASTNGSTVLLSHDSMLLGWLATGFGGGSTFSVMIFLPWVRACLRTLVAPLKLEFLFAGLGLFGCPLAGKSSSLNAE